MVKAKVTVSALVLALVATLWPGSAARAGDASGNYIARGVGAQSCQAFLTAVEGGVAETIRPYVNWMEGYISGVNRFQGETYDSAPVISSGDVGNIALSVCRSSPEILFETAIARMLQYFEPYRIKAQSQLIELTVGDTSAAVRQETMRWIQEKLAAEGMFTGDVNGLYGGDTRTALVAYQNSREMAATGVPDAATLIRFITEDLQSQ